MSNQTPRYQLRRQLVRDLANNPNATEQDWIEASVRFHEGDLADTRYPMWAREMGWFLLACADRLIGATNQEVITASHYAGVEVRQGSDGGFSVVGPWRHG